MRGTAPGVAIGPSDVELAADGDEVAFARLVDLHHADMARVAFVVTSDRAMAQDALQSAWVIAWRKLPSVRDHRRVRWWLLRVAANEARQLVRARRRVVLVEIDPRLEAAREADPAVGIARVDLVRALGRLSPEDSRTAGSPIRRRCGRRRAGIVDRTIRVGHARSTFAIDGPSSKGTGR